MADKNVKLKVYFGQFSKDEIIPKWTFQSEERLNNFLANDFAELTDEPCTVDVKYEDLFPPVTSVPETSSFDLLAKKEKEIESSNIVLKARLEQAEARVKDLVSENKFLSNTNAEITTKLNEATLQLTGSNNALSMKTVENAELKKDSEALASCKRERDKLEKANHELAMGKEKAEAEAYLAKADVAELQGQVAALNQEIGKKTVLISELEAKIKSLTVDVVVEPTE